MKRESSILKILESLPYVEYDEAQQTLIRLDWNYEAAWNDLKQKHGFLIYFSIIRPNGQESEKLSSIFNPDEDAFQIIGYLNTVRPVENLYYKLYKDSACSQSMSYLQLSNTFRQLGIAKNTLFFVKKDNQYPE